MIFVTVGTHEQPFDRLVKEIDHLKGENLITGEVFVQTGYSLYKPEFCQYKDFIRFDEMIERMAEAELVITHGGTGSIMLVLYHQKIPMVMPRQKKYNEHIDDHQVLFCRTMEAKGKIMAVYETPDLGPAIEKYRRTIQFAEGQVSGSAEKPGRKPGDKSGLSEPGIPVNIQDRAAVFARRLNEICLELVRKK